MRLKKDPSLARIVIILVLLLVGAAGIHRALRWYDDTHRKPALARSAAEDLTTAQELIEEGKTNEAISMLNAIAARLDHDTITPQALQLLAKVQEETGQTEQALATLKKAAENFPSSGERPRSMLAYARLLEKTGRFEEAVEAYRDLRNTAPPELRASALTGLGRAAERDNRLLDARDLYRQAVKDAAWNSPEWDEAADALGHANVRLVFSGEPAPESRVYLVEKGDTLTDIGNKLNITQGMLLRANRLDERTPLRVGHRLHYTPKDFRIVIERSTCRLFLLDKDGLFKQYAVGLGRPGHETTLGTYKIGNKQKDPTWFKPGEGPIPPGDPRNELGTRWMPFVPLEEDLPGDLGIHGTDKIETVGTYSSSGCARMRREDVEELYDLVVRSTPVDIVDVFTPSQYPKDF